MLGTQSWNVAFSEIVHACRWFFYVLVLKQSIDTECALWVYPDDDVGLSENPFLRVLNTEMNKNLCGEVIDVEAGRNGWFDLNRGEPGFPGTVPCLITLAVPCAELLQVEGAPDVPEPGVVCSLSVIWLAKN